MYLNFETNHLMILRRENVSEQGPPALHPVLGSGLEQTQQTEPRLALFAGSWRDPEFTFPSRSHQVLSLKGSASAAGSPATLVGTGKIMDRKVQSLQGWTPGKGEAVLCCICFASTCRAALPSPHTPAGSSRGSCKGTGG